MEEKETPKIEGEDSSICPEQTGQAADGISESNKKRGKREKMKEYGGLKPADHCKKFMSSNALYWKP